MNLDSISVMNWRNRRKQELIKYKGGKCEKCGYDKIQFPSSFAFHHLNPDEKEFTISGTSFSAERLKKEVDKCKLLCVRCHAEHHDEEMFEKRRTRQSTKPKYSKLHPIKCAYCEKTFSPTNNKRKFCGEKCWQLNQRIVKRPEKDELEKILSTSTYEAVGRQFGVSGTAIKKWAKNYGIKKKRVL